VEVYAFVLKPRLASLCELYFGNVTRENLLYIPSKEDLLEEMESPVQDCLDDFTKVSRGCSENGTVAMAEWFCYFLQPNLDVSL